MKYRCVLGPLTLPIFLFLALTSAGQPARAQSSAADRARLLRTESAFQTPNNVSAEGVDQNYAAASPNDADLGEQAILKRVESYDPFTLETGVPIYYTSNVALVDHGQVGAAITAPVVGLTYAPRFQHSLVGDFTLRQQFFYYSNDLSSLNLFRTEAAQSGAARERRF
jgi:hypothetical protein